MRLSDQDVLALAWRVAPFLRSTHETHGTLSTQDIAEALQRVGAQPSPRTCQLIDHYMQEGFV